MLMHKLMATIMLALAALGGPLALLAAPAGAAAPPFQLVKDLKLAPEPVDGTAFTRMFVPRGDAVFFSAVTPEHGSELWITDGSETGTWHATGNPSDHGHQSRRRRFIPGPSAGPPPRSTFVHRRRWHQRPRGLA